MITLYTDGGCWPNPGGQGGWAYVLIKDSVKVSESSGTISAPCTNNRAEMIAAIEGLRDIPNGEPVLLISDSELLLKCAEGHWKRKKNRDLWEEFDDVSRGKRLTYQWVRGHDGNEHNERCDELASDAVKRHSAKPAMSDTVAAEVYDCMRRLNSLAAKVSGRTAAATIAAFAAQLKTLVNAEHIPTDGDAECLALPPQNPPTNSPASTGRTTSSCSRGSPIPTMTTLASGTTSRTRRE